MANPFLNTTDLMERDIETALLLEKAIVHNIGRAVAYTDGNKMYINTEDNLNNILPAYDQRMLKWLLWHEKMHLELRHHNRFFKYLDELKDTKEEFGVAKEEVNIIMDILVHDSMAKMFPELVETALTNIAQFRNRNSLKYTFKTHTLEEMLDEYKSYKKEDEPKGSTKADKTGEDEPKEDEEKEEDTKKDTPTKGSAEKDEPKIKEESERPEALPDEHDKTDWSKLDNIDDKEFITQKEGDDIQTAVESLKRKKFKLAKLTETLNGLVTSTRKRSYIMPSTIYTGGRILLKGSTPGRTKLYLVFDASGSMSNQMEMFKEIISKSIPQAMETQCEWFAGWNRETTIEPYKTEHGDGYYKAQFKNFMKVYAHNGYDDDGDRTIELCWQAEQLGYSPIGVTDGGGTISWSKDKLKQLKRTVFVGQNSRWLARAKEINPRIQILSI